MSYAISHHLWRPLAAISNQELAFVTAMPVTTTSLTVLDTSRLPLTPTTSPLLMISPTTATVTDESNDVWMQIRGMVLRNGTESLLGELVEGNCSSSCGVNVSSLWFNETDTVYMNSTWDIVGMVGTAIALGLIILATVIGNVFVIAAILLERNLQNVANYLILSLAVADLLVACLVMPLGAVYEVSNEWTLGPELCDMWTSSDVLCCTASILHLVAIALDRYWAVTNIDYIHHRTAKRIGLMILVIWSVAFLVCIAPAVGWKDAEWYMRVENKTCLVSQEIGYQIFATSSSFYLPLMVILILYWRIFQTARKRIRRRQVATGGASSTTKTLPSGGIAGGLAAASGTGGIAAAVVTVIGRPLPTISETTTAFTTVSSNNTSPEKTSFANGLEVDLPTTTDCSIGGGYQPPPSQHFYPAKRKSKDSADSKRERKAAKTLAIITGAFVMCWLPFFVMAVLLPVKKDLFEDYVISLFLWLGYFNSTLNPIIYTIFSPEFRHAFKKLLCGRKYAAARRKNRHFGVRHFQ